MPSQAATWARLPSAAESTTIRWFVVSVAPCRNPSADSRTQPRSASPTRCASSITYSEYSASIRFRLEPEVRGQLLGGHDHRGGRRGQRQAERPGVLGPAGDRGQAPVKVPPELTPEAVGGDDDAGRAGAARHVRRHDVLRHQRLARARGERQDEPPHRGIERVRRAVEQLELRGPQGQHRRVAQGHRARRGLRHRRRQMRPDRGGAEIVGDVTQVRRDPPGVEVELRVRRIGSLVEQLPRPLEPVRLVVREVDDEVVAALDHPRRAPVRRLDQVRDARRSGPARSPRAAARGAGRRTAACGRARARPSPRPATPRPARRAAGARTGAAAGTGRARSGPDHPAGS